MAGSSGGMEALRWGKKKHRVASLPLPFVDPPAEEEQRQPSDDNGMQRTHRGRRQREGKSELGVETQG